MRARSPFTAIGSDGPVMRIRRSARCCSSRSSSTSSTKSKVAGRSGSSPFWRRTIAEKSRARNSISSALRRTSAFSSSALPSQCSASSTSWRAGPARPRSSSSSERARCTSCDTRRSRSWRMRSTASAAMVRMSARLVAFQRSAAVVVVDPANASTSETAPAKSAMMTARRWPSVHPAPTTGMRYRSVRLIVGPVVKSR